MTHRKKWPLILACLFIVSLWVWQALKPAYSSTPALDVWMLNIGQGESVFLREPSGKTILFDGGPDDSVLSQLGSVMPAWQHTIDLVILSHNHSDHLHGIISVLKRYQVNEVWTSGAIESSDDYYAFIAILKQNHLKNEVHFFDAEECTHAASCPPIFQIGKATIQVYHPLKDMTGQEPHDQHDATLSVKVSYGQESIFLAGDLNEQHEAQMTNACLPPSCSLQATVLQVPHHGSKTGLASYFLTAIHPSLSLIPVGINNSYGMPGANILDRLHTANIPIYRTDTQGRIHVVVYTDRLIVSPEKP